MVEYCGSTHTRDGKPCHNKVTERGAKCKKHTAWALISRKRLPKTKRKRSGRG